MKRYLEICNGLPAIDSWMVALVETDRGVLQSRKIIDSSREARNALEFCKGFQETYPEPIPIRLGTGRWDGHSGRAIWRLSGVKAAKEIQ
jgi:hypothetical protein